MACSGVTLAAVATAMSIQIDDAEIKAVGEMDFRGTLGVDRTVYVGLQRLKLEFAIASPASDDQLAKLVELTERYCVIWQTLHSPGKSEAVWSRS